MQNARDEAIRLTQELLNANACDDAKNAARAWISAVGTAGEADATRAYVAELREDLVSIDGLIEFAGSKAAVGYMGEDGAKKLLAHAIERKSAGYANCDCPACAAAEAILRILDK